MSEREGCERLLIVVDMLKGFCCEGNPLFCGPQAREIIPTIAAHIEANYSDGETVIFLQDSHEKGDPEFEMFPEHCVIGTEEVDIVPELVGLASNEVVVPKNRYSGFHGTQLAELIEARKPALIEVCGVCTNICVMYTVEELRNRYYAVRVLKEMVASFDSAAHDFALGQMETILGAEVA